MRVGMVGLGRMGASMPRRLLKNGHECVVHDSQPSAVVSLAKDGATGASSLREMGSTLAKPRAIWLMVPAPVLSAALYERFTSRGNADFANRILSAMRHEFGGHVEKPAS